VEVSPRGTITTFCIVNLPFYGQRITPPYVCASIRLDGADTTLFHLIQETPAEEGLAIFADKGSRSLTVMISPAPGGSEIGILVLDMQ
jgi:hypothetical protein